MRSLRKVALPFSVLLGLGLTIAVPLLLLEFNADGSSSWSEIAIAVLLAVLIAVGSSVVVLLLYVLVVVLFPRFLHRVMVWITFKMVRKAIATEARTVEATGITSIEGDVGIGLPLGIRDGVASGQRFVVLNTASQEKWGVLEVAEVQHNSCVCLVFDRINPDFWTDLEKRMRHDASPPLGVTIRREIPEEVLFDLLQSLLRVRRD